MRFRRHTEPDTLGPDLDDHIDWESLPLRTEPLMEQGWEPLELGHDEDDPTEIAQIDAYIRRRNRRAIQRERESRAA